MSTVDPATATFASSDCTLAGGETGTGFRNDGGLVRQWRYPDDGHRAVRAFPIIRMAKTLTSSVVGIDGRYTVTYGADRDQRRCGRRAATP